MTTYSNAFSMKLKSGKKICAEVIFKSEQQARHYEENGLEVDFARQAAQKFLDELMPGETLADPNKDDPVFEPCDYFRAHLIGVVDFCDDDDFERSDDEDY